jgi:hypothetical protein
MADRSLTKRLALFLLAGLFVWLSAGIIDTVNHPMPQTLEAAVGGATIHFAADRTQFVFPGDCSAVRWEVGGIRAVHFYTYPVIGTGEQVVCHGDAPYLRVRFRDGEERTYTLNRDVLFLRPAVTAAALLALGAGALAAHFLGLSRLLATRRGQHFTGLALAIAGVVILDLFTNSAYIVIGPTFDAARTMEIARHGWLGNPNLLAPWAYRPMTPLLARALSDVLGQPLDTGFALLAYTGAIAQLMLVYALARYFGANFRAAMAAMLVVGLSFYNLRFLLYDIYRPDLLGFALFAAVLLALWRGRIAVALLLACFGLLTREFMAIPAALLILKLLVEGIQERSWRKLAWSVMAVIAIGSTIVLPRALIPVADSAQRFDPLNRPDALAYELLQPWRNTPRNYEFLAVAASYLLPVFILATPGRLARAWRELAPHRWLLAAYAVLTFLLTLYGGGDVERFFAYMFVMQVIALAVWLRDAGWLEIGLMLVVVAAVNRLFWMPDVDPATRVLWIGSMVEPAITAQRLQEVGLYIAVALGLRVIQLSKANRQKPVLLKADP